MFPFAQIFLFPQTVCLMAVICVNGLNKAVFLIWLCGGTFDI